MFESGDLEFLMDIMESIRRIGNYTRDMDYEIFLEDTKTQDAVLRNIEIIGEASKNISDKLRKSHPEIQWKNIAGMRDKVIHFYFGVNWDIVWDVVRNKLSVLKMKIGNVLEEFPENK